MPRHIPSAHRGFTLPEIILVLVLLGIVAAVALPRMISDRGFSEYGFAEELSSAMRYAQQVAVARNGPVRVELDADRFRICLGANPCALDPDRYLLNPGSGRFWNGAEGGQGLAPSGIGMTPRTTVIFQGMGQAVLEPAGVEAACIVIGERSIRIAAETGHVEVRLASCPGQT